MNSLVFLFFCTHTLLFFRPFIVWRGTSTILYQIRDSNWTWMLPSRFPHRVVLWLFHGTQIVAGYYPGGYYQPAAAGPLLPQPIAQTCLLAHHIPVRVPHAQVKVLIHNPDTPHDLAAFSERTYTGKSSDSNNNSSSVNNDIGNISNKNSGSVRGNSASKYSETDVSVITSSNSKKRTFTDNNKSKNVSGKKSAESRVELKNRDVEKACKRKYEKRKAKVTKTEVEVKEEKEVKREEPEVPDHGWRWIGEPEVKKIPSVVCVHDEWKEESVGPFHLTCYLNGVGERFTLHCSHGVSFEVCGSG